MILDTSALYSYRNGVVQVTTNHQDNDVYSCVLKRSQRHEVIAALQVDSSRRWSTDGEVPVLS